MKTITPDIETLRRYMPNCIHESLGEISVYDKILPYMETAGEWVYRHLTGGAESGEPGEESGVRAAASRVVCCETWRKALPALDVVLTANGFAVAGNENLTPASRARVEALTRSLEEERDTAIGALLKELPALKAWRESGQGRWFGATLFQDLDVTEETGVDEHRWAEYIRLRARIMDIEESLAEDWMSAELMEALRSELASRTLSMERAALVKTIKGQIVAVLQGGAFSSRRLTEAVNFIRRNPDEFGEWHSSHVAELFMPPKFRNEKKSSGYFF